MFCKKLINLFIIFLILIISIGVVSADDNTTHILSDDSTTPISNEKSFEGIQLEIDNAKENDTIELEGIYLSNGNNINITKPLTLESSNGATLNANSKSTILNISNVSVCLKNINFINSKSYDTAAIYSEGNLEIQNCHFKDNIMHFSIDESDYHDSSKSAGAVYSTNDLTVINSTFEDNSASGERYILYYESMTDIHDVIDRYEHYSYAGAIESCKSLSLTNSNFINSSLYCYGYTDIANSTFKNADLNLSDYTNITKTNFIKNSIIDTYDVSRENHTTVIFNECNFSNYNSSIIDTWNSEIYIFNSNFKNNNKTAIIAENVFIENSTFTNNRGQISGAVEGWNLTLTNCNFIDNIECAVLSHENATIDGNNYIGLNAFDNSLNIIDKLIKMTIKNTVIQYASEITPQVKLTSTQTGNPIKDYQVKYAIYKGNKKVYEFDNYWQDEKKGIMTFTLPKLNVGTYKLEIDDLLIHKNITFKIIKANTIIKAAKITSKYKKSKYFKVTVIHKTTKELVKYKYVRIKIDKKTYKVKTNSKGIAQINTKGLKIGTHKVTITSGNSNYKMSAKSTITIKR